MVPNNNRFIWASSLGVLTVIAAAAIFSGSLLGSSGKGDVRPDSPLAVPAPELALATAGGEILLSERRGKVLLLYFPSPVDLLVRWRLQCSGSCKLNSRAAMLMW